MEAKPHSPRLERTRFRLSNVSCASCATPLKRRLERIRGVEWIGFNPVLDLIIIDYDPRLIDRSEIMEAVEKAGFIPSPPR